MNYPEAESSGIRDKTAYFDSAQHRYFDSASINRSVQVAERSKK